MFQSGSSAVGVKHDTWITGRRELCPSSDRSVCRSWFSAGKTKELLRLSVYRKLTPTDSSLCPGERFGRAVRTPPARADTHTQGHLSRKASLNTGEERDVTICPSSSDINAGYRSILESTGSHYLSSVTYLDCYGCDCAAKGPPDLDLSDFPSVIVYRSGGNRDVWRVLIKTYPPPNKSMLTVCLPRLGDSPTLWFLIRHIMRRREIGIWAEDCCTGPDWFDCVCISSASIDGNDFDRRAALSPLLQTLSGGKCMHFTSLFQ